MTKIEKKLKELGYKRFGFFQITKKYKTVEIYVYQLYKEDGTGDWVGDIVPTPIIISNINQIKDLQTAWDILQSDLKKINNMEEKWNEKEFVISTTTTSM